MRGVYTALVTPFNSNGEIDLPAFRKLLADQRAAGITGVIPCGTTGETPTLSTEEKKLLIETSIKELKGSGVKVLAGTGANDTAEAVSLSKWASDAGADGLLVVTPYYNKPTQAGLIAHYLAIADKVSCEIMLYNVPGRTGISFTPQTVVELAKHPRIRSIKEASGNVQFSSEVLELLASTSLKMDILSGDDALYMPLLSIGGSGVVSVASNLFPRAMVEIFKAFEAGNITQAIALHQKFYPLFRDLFIESNPSPVKYALAQVGMCTEHVRLPLVPLQASSRETLNQSLVRCGIVSGKGTL